MLPLALGGIAIAAVGYGISKCFEDKEDCISAMAHAFGDALDKVDEGFDAIESYFNKNEFKSGEATTDESASDDTTDIPRSAKAMEGFMKLQEEMMMPSLMFGALASRGDKPDVMTDRDAWGAHHPRHVAEQGEEEIATDILAHEGRISAIAKIFHSDELETMLAKTLTSDLMQAKGVSLTFESSKAFPKEKIVSAIKSFDAFVREDAVFAFETKENDRMKPDEILCRIVLSGLPEERA